MEVTSATSVSSLTTTASSSSAAASTASLDYDAFLQLLIAEMQNQDPTNPTDATEYMSQFAQFSMVEQSIETNTKLESLLAASALEQADGLIGRTITFTSTDGDAVSGTIAAVSIISGGSVATLTDGTSVYLGEGVTIS